MSPFKLLPVKLFLAKLCLVTALVCIAFPVLANDEERKAKQDELDAACATARSQALIPLRKEMVDGCVRKEEFESRGECEAYYADYGERAGGRQPLFYDLPACVKAFDYAQSERSGG